MEQKLSRSECEMAFRLATFAQQALAHLKQCTDSVRTVTFAVEAVWLSALVYAVRPTAPSVNKSCMTWAEMCTISALKAASYAALMPSGGSGGVGVDGGNGCCCCDSGRGSVLALAIAPMGIKLCIHTCKSISAARCTAKKIEIFSCACSQ